MSNLARRCVEWINMLNPSLTRAVITAITSVRNEYNHHTDVTRCPSYSTWRSIIHHPRIQRFFSNRRSLRLSPENVLTSIICDNSIIEILSSVLDLSLNSVDDGTNQPTKFNSAGVGIAQYQYVNQSWLQDLRQRSS